MSPMPCTFTFDSFGSDSDETLVAFVNGFGGDIIGGRKWCLASERNKVRRRKSASGISPGTFVFLPGIFMFMPGECMFVPGKMADEPGSSGRNEVKDQSAEENITLIDTIDDPLLEWVGAEPRGIASAYSRRSRSTPSLNARICSEFSEYGFPMYEIAFKDLGLKLPFSDFQSKRLFRMYMDYVRGFKDKWYIVRPIMQTALDYVYEEETAVTDDHGEPLMDDEGRPIYVDIFFPARWATREGKDILNEDGYPTFEARPIDTKALVECQSYGQAANLLGHMVGRKERLLKLTQDKKVNKRMVRAPQATRMGPPTSSGDTSGGSPDSQDVEQHIDLIPRKRNRVESQPEVSDESGAEGFFEGFPLTVSTDEADTIRRLSKESRRKHLAANMVGMVKMAKMAVVLAEEGAHSDRVKELEQEKAALVVSSRKLKAALESFEEMFREQAELLATEKENSGKVAEERDYFRLDQECLESDNGHLAKEFEDLKAAMLPAEDESEETAPLQSRSELVARIQLLETDCVGALADGFEAAVSQLTLLNPGLNTKGVDFMSQIIDDQVMPPPESHVVDAGSPGEV
ncbi:hypothetical protein RYX36_008607 [Vicia faba]